jgi:hypothetical protein
VTADDYDYLAREARARIEIDRQLVAAGWALQQADHADINAGPGVVVHEFILEKDHGRVDYLLFVNGQPAGVIEAKPEGTTLTEVERQSGKYVDGLPTWMQPPVYPLPFTYESTGKETRFTNGYDPDARSRRIFTFHRPETLAEWSRQISANPTVPTFPARLRSMPELDARRPRHTLTGHTEPVGALVVAPGGSWLASAGEDREMRIWDLAAARCSMSLRTGHRLGHLAVATSALPRQAIAGRTSG